MWPCVFPLPHISSTTSSNICTCFSSISGSSLPAPWAQSPRDLPLRLHCCTLSQSRATLLDTWAPSVCSNSIHGFSLSLCTFPLETRFNMWIVGLWSLVHISTEVLLHFVSLYWPVRTQFTSSFKTFSHAQEVLGLGMCKRIKKMNKRGRFFVLTEFIVYQGERHYVVTPANVIADCGKCKVWCKKKVRAVVRYYNVNLMWSRTVGKVFWGREP